MLGLGSSITSGNFFSKNYLLDDVSDAVGAYSLRKLRLNYTGPAVRVRRTSDDAEKDIYFKADGTLDVSTLESFCSATDGKVVRWYNQVEGEPTTPLDKTFGQNAALALSVRQLDSGYSGPCMSVKGSEDMIGLEHLQLQEEGASKFGGRVASKSTTHFSTAESGVTTCEVYIDIAEESKAGLANGQVSLRVGYKSSTVGERGMILYATVPNRTWTKLTLDTSTAAAGGDSTISSERFEIWLGGTSPQYRTGDKLLVRNIKCTAPSYPTHTMDEESTGFQVFPISQGQETKFIDSYDVGFDSKGNLDTDKIDAFSTAYKGGVLELEVDDTLGDADNNIGAKRSFTGHTGNTTWTYEVEVYADCPSIGQNTNVEFAAQSGNHTVSSAQFTPTSVEQRKWTKVTFSRTGTGQQLPDTRVHFSIAGTNFPDQQLADGDRVYIRAASGTCAADSSLNWTADFSSDADGWTEVSAGDGADEYDDFTLSYVTDPKGSVAVTKWYDQSGGGNDVAQVNHNRMPLIYKYDSTKDEYCITESNDKPAVELSEDAYFTETAFTGNTSTGLSVFLTGNRNEQLGAASGRAIFALGPDGSDADADSTYEVFEVASFQNILRVYRDGTEFGTDPNDYGQDDYSTGSTEASQTRQYALHVTQKVNKTGFANLDGGSNDVWEEDAIDHQGYDSLAIGSRVNTGGSVSTSRDDVEYRLCELLFYDEDRSSDAPNIRENMNDYYRTYSAGDAIQTSLSNQPRIVSSGTVDTVNNVPVIRVEDTYLDASSNTNMKASRFDAYIFYKADSNDNQYLLFTTNDVSASGSYSPAVQNHLTETALAGEYNAGNLSTSLNLYANNVEFEYNNGVTIRKEMLTSLKTRAAALSSGSVEVHEAAQTDNWTVSSNFAFFINGYPNFRLTGHIGELIFFDADKSSDRQFIQDSMQNHFEVEPFDAPLSESYGSGAKSAFSLRKVNDSYGGPAIRVRNQSTDVERDIYFDSFGNLDIVDLESFADGSQLHCSKWYDQSGNGNHATQTNENGQPEITDSSGNVYTQSGRAQMKWVNGSGNQTRMFANTNDSLLGLSTLDAYIAYDPQGDTNYILFSGNASNAGGPFSYVVHAGEGDNTGEHSNYGGGSLFLDGSQVTVDSSTTRADLSTALSNSGIQIEVHQGHSTNTGAWATFGIAGYSGRGLDGGFISEILLFGEDKSSNRTDLQDNMNNYYYAY